jgi:mannose/fructose/N-acetylgalactosamine-specific phosphotransferase system component IIC
MLLLSALGGVLALDATSLGQFMISRPLVGGALTGWFLGDPLLGLEVGALLEIFHIAGMPAGGSRVPETGPAAVAAVAVAVATGGAPGLALGTVVGLVTSDLGGMTVGVQRHVSASLIGRVEAGRATPAHLDAAHLSLMAMDFFRGAAVTAVAIWAGSRLAGASGPWWTLGHGPTIGIVLMGASFHLGALLKGLGGWRSRRVLFMVGALSGLVGVYLT